MKRVILLSVLVLAALLAFAPAFAADEGGSSPGLVLRPSISIGYVGDMGDLGYSLSTVRETPALGGIPVREFNYHDYSSLYIDAALAATIGERLGAEISTRWAVPTHTDELNQEDYHVVPPSHSGGRTWEARTLWSVTDVNVSYALVKDASILKSFAPKVGVRWDYWDIEGDDPFDRHGAIVVYAPSDTMEFYASTVMPYAGLSMTFGGLQWGMFGGDLEVEAVAGFLAWGETKHDELRNSGGFRNDVFEGDLNSGYFYEISLDYTLLTLEFSPKVTGTAGIFGRISGYHATGDLEGTRNAVTGPFEYEFVMDRELFITGINLAVTFDIYGRPQPVTPPPAPAPVIEPKLEPMTKN
jgi:hypothetical protein